MSKETKKILTLLTLFLVVLFTISCNKGNTKSEGIGKYAGEWFESQYINENSGENEKYTIDNNTKPTFVIKSDGSISFTSSGIVIKDFTQDSEKSYSYEDSYGYYNVLEFKNDTECVNTTISSESGDAWTTIYIKR